MIAGQAFNCGNVWSASRRVGYWNVNNGGCNSGRVNNSYGHKMAVIHNRDEILCRSLVGGRTPVPVPAPVAVPVPGLITLSL